MNPAHGHGWRALSGLLRTFLRPYAGRAWIVVGLLVVQAAGNLYLPILNADIINGGVVDGDVGYIWRTGGVMLGIAFVLGLVAIATTYLASRVSMGVGADLRAAVYRRVQDFSAGEMHRFGIPSLITRNINDTDQVELFLQGALTQLVIAVFICAGGLILAIRESPALSLLLVVALPLMGAVIVITLALILPLFRTSQVRIDRINAVLREQITGVRVIRAFGRTLAEQQRYQVANAGVTAPGLRVNRIFALGVPVLLAVLNLTSVAVIWFGGRLIGEGSMPIGNLTAFLIYILQILLYVVIAVTVLLLMPRAVAGAERIRAVLDTVPAIADPPEAATPAVGAGSVEFHQVTFGYPGSERAVLDDLTFLLPAGQLSGIIGGTGSGKSTLLSLIMRFCTATEGTVSVNGVDVRGQAAERLRAGIGLVPQSAYLFRGTVASNLRFGRPEATDAELWHALEIAQAAEFVASMPGQLAAPIDQGGTNVSGGQRQRLSIARAVVRQPRLYLFDDCFSALDAVTDARLRAALAAETQDATVVIVAQRVSTIMDADQIIVLEGGAVAGRGRHRELLASCGAYQEIVASQLGQGALA